MADWTDEKYVEVWARLMGWTRKEMIKLNYIYWEDEDGRTWYSNASGDKLDPVHDWNQCMMLVEKMRADGYEIELGFYPDGSNGATLATEAGGDDPGIRVYSADGDTPQRAIIRACDLAMEVE